MAGKTIAQKANALVSHYIKLYREKYTKDPTVNRYKERWGFQAMIEDLGEQKAYQVVDHYFKTGRVGHPIQYLLMNYEKLAKVMEDLQRDEADRIALREQTKKRVEEWEQQIDNERTESNQRSMQEQ